MAHNMTVEILDKFSTRLHINTILNLVINIPTMYLIIFHSSKPMGYYKYYLLYSVVTTIIMDIHQSLFYGIYFLLPSMASCCSSYCRYFGMIWGPQVNYLIFNLNISIVGIGLVSLAGYRYYSVSGDLKRLESKYSFPVLFLIGIFYPTPTIIALVVASFNQSPEELLDLINSESPEYASLVQMGMCSSFKTRTLGFMYIGISAIQIGLIESLGLFWALKTAKLLKSVRKSLSKSTYSAQKQLLISMALQNLIPMFTLTVPISAVMTLALLNVRYSGFASEIAVHMMTLHAPFNGLTIILTIKPYRDALKKFITTKSSSPSIITVQVTTTTDFAFR